MSPANFGRKCTLPRRGLTVPGKRRKRGGPVATPSDAAASTSPWASLHEDLVRLVAWRVLAPRGVPSLAGKRRVPARPRRGGRALPPAAMDAAAGGLPPVPGTHEAARAGPLLQPPHGHLRQRGAPDLKDHYAMDSVDGLLLLQRDHDMAVRLFHPFTGDIVELPSLATLVASCRR
ncbi:unnamed protein product [Urochloa humidicola]